MGRNRKLLLWLSIPAAVIVLALVAFVFVRANVWYRGAAEEAAFTEQFEADPAVERLFITGLDDPPWEGRLSGRVIAAEGLDDATVRELSDRLGQYIAAPPAGARMDYLTFRFGRFELLISGDDSWNTAQLNLLLEARSRADVESGRLWAPASENPASLRLGTRDPQDLAAVFAFGAESLERLHDSSEDVLDAMYGADGEEPTHSVRGRPSPERAEPAFAAWEAVEQVTPVQGLAAAVSDDGVRLEFTIADADSAEEAERAAAEAAGEDTETVVRAGQET